MNGQLFSTRLAQELGSDVDADTARQDPWLVVQEGRLNEDRLLDLFAQTYGLSVAQSPQELVPDQDFVTAVPIDCARRGGMLGVESAGARLKLLISDPHALDAIDDAHRLTGRPVVLLLTRREEVQAAINRAYERRATVVDEVVEQWDVRDLDDELQNLEHSDDLLDMAHRAPVIKLVNAILFEAIRQQASDIHIQPEESGVQVRMRVDGVLYDRMPIPAFLLNPLVSRVKIMGRMNVSERRMPQDGRCTARIGSRIVDLRVSSIPCSKGERIVMRLLDKSGSLFSLEQLGMSVTTRERFEDMLGSSHGIILITGPTGSGKTTTLYGALQRLQSKERNILTLEDPIEYQLDGISQMQINTKKGVTFASGLRHILRQDPDVIMVGEIRDEETARMAVQSSLTGHLVFATLHTNDAPGAVARLLDLGVEPFLVASSLLGVMGQRLVRRLCPDCRSTYEPDPAERAELSNATPDGSAAPVLYRADGCRACLQRGFVGREGIFELLMIDHTMRHCISQRQEANQIRAAATRQNFRSLRTDGIEKALAGKTTLQEVMRVTLREEA
jgi:general secretion pathway protein E